MENDDINSIVGKVAGSICEALATHRPIQGRCMFLAPAITYKVHRVLSTFIPGVKNSRRLKKVVKDLRLATEQVMKFYDYNATTIKKLKNPIEIAILHCLINNQFIFKA